MKASFFSSSPEKNEADMAVLYAARNGDKDSAAQLILALGPNAHALAWRMVNNTAEAQDIVQESFLKLFKSARYEGRSSLSTFFYAIVSNACLDFLRKKHTESPVMQWTHRGPDQTNQGELPGSSGTQTNRIRGYSEDRSGTRR